jgi:hypothetical protein
LLRLAADLVAGLLAGLLHPLARAGLLLSAELAGSC